MGHWVGGGYSAKMIEEYLADPDEPIDGDFASAVYAMSHHKKSLIEPTDTGGTIVCKGLVSVRYGVFRKRKFIFVNALGGRDDMPAVYEVRGDGVSGISGFSKDHPSTPYANLALKLLKAGKAKSVPRKEMSWMLVDDLLSLSSHDRREKLLKLRLTPRRK